jgi:rSAM/selenodomain-associated transferase 1
MRGFGLLKAAIIIFTRTPIPGKTKTRLQNYLTPIECAQLHKNFIKDVYVSCKDTGKDIFIFYTPNEGLEILRKIFIDELRYYPQTGSDIGVRMGNAIDTVLTLGYDRCVLIGTDIPTIKSKDIISALDKLDDSDISLIPTYDGGYCLIGMKKSNMDVFIHQSYGHSEVIVNTKHNLYKLGLSYYLCNPCLDIDEKEDLIELWNNKNNKEYYCGHTQKYLETISSLFR